MSKRKLTYDDFKRYFSNNVQNKDKHAFEKDMMRDAFEEEAFEGLSKLRTNELENDIAELKNGITNQTRRDRKMIPSWFKYAASLLILIGIGSTIILMLNNRFWQDSLMKEQVSQDIISSDSEKLESLVKPSESDSSLQLNQNILEAPMLVQKQDVAKPQKEIHLKRVEEQLEISDMIFLDEEMEIEADKAIEISEFEKKEEAVVEEQSALAVVSEQKLNELEKQNNVVIRGVSSIPKSAKKTEKVIAADQSKSKPIQSRTIKGKVLGSEDDLSIPGVSIVLKDNPTIGVTTNMNGEFELRLTEDDEALKILIASFVGMETQEIRLEGDSNILVYMEPDVLEMDEVVVSAYGINREKSDEVYKTSAKHPQYSTIRKYKEAMVDKLDNSKIRSYPGIHKVKIRMELASSGKVANIRITNTPNDTFNQEIERIIMLLGSWIPATENNQNISSNIQFNLKIKIE